MDYAWSVSSGAAVARKYVVGASVANAGIPLIEPTAGAEGLLNGTVSDVTNAVGVAIDTATYTTTQSTTSDIEAVATVIISPDAVYKAKMSGGATENTALQIFTVTTADSAGTSVLVDNDPNSPDMNEGTCWGYSGANVSVKRRIEATAANDATITVPFMPIAVGDQFLMVPFWFFGLETVKLTTNLYQVNAAAGSATTDAEFEVVDMDLRDKGENGTTNSYVYLLFQDHVLGTTT